MSGHIIRPADILAATSPIPPELRSLILMHHGRVRRNLHRSGATNEDRLLAAEQWARMSVVYHAYGSGEGAEGESESLVTDMIDASLCANGRKGSWQQSVFVSSFDREKEREVAELTSLVLATAQGGASALESEEEEEVVSGRDLSADQFLEYWDPAPAQGGRPIAIPDGQPTRELVRHVDWPQFLRPHRGRSRSEGDLLHAAELRSLQDLAHELWQRRADEAESGGRGLSLHWPPPASSLIGLCLTPPQPHSRPDDELTLAQRTYRTVSRHVCAAMHPWCLRCYRQRTRTSSPTPLQELLSMALGVHIILMVEAYIAWTDDRTQKEVAFLARVMRAWSLFLDTEVAPPSSCVEEEQQEEETPPVRLTHRSLSCSF